MTKIENYFPKFGVNKINEIERLIFEISKIESSSTQDLLLSIKGLKYESAKLQLLKRRYPQTFNKNAKPPLSSFYLPKHKINKDLIADTAPSEFAPAHIFYVKKAADSAVFCNVRNLFPYADTIEIESLKSFQKSKGFKPADYNNRLQNLFLTQEKHDFFKQCPCSVDAVRCGYGIMNIGMGCPYECSYCFLQGYQNIGGIVLPYNIDDYLREDKISLLGNEGGFFNYKRIGSGEFTDSLVFDHISNFSPKIVEFFRAKKEIYFEFKTKSINISNLLSVGGAENVVVAWSLNSFKMKKENEFKTPSILERLNAAKAVAEAGFSVAFHFDPLIFYPDWRAGYKETVDALFDIVPNGSIKWISLGALRMAAELKKVIENRFPRNKIMDAELLLDSDYKLKYSADTRIEMFDFMLKLLGQKTQKTQIYLCMENKLIHKSVKK